MSMIETTEQLNETHTNEDFAEIKINLPITWFINLLRLILCGKLFDVVHSLFKYARITVDVYVVLLIHNENNNNFKTSLEHV